MENKWAIFNDENEIEMYSSLCAIFFTKKEAERAKKFGVELGWYKKTFKIKKIETKEK